MVFGCWRGDLLRQVGGRAGGCGVGRCWRWAAGCCEVWQGVQAVQLVGCGVIGAALAVLLVSVSFWLAVRVGGVICCGGGVLVGSSTGPGRH